MHDDEVTDIEVEGLDVTSTRRAWMVFGAGSGPINPSVLRPGQSYVFPDDGMNPAPVDLHISACSGPAGELSSFDSGVERAGWEIAVGEEEGSLRINFWAEIPMVDDGIQMVEGAFDLVGPVYDDADTE